MKLTDAYRLFQKIKSLQWRFEASEVKVGDRIDLDSLELRFFKRRWVPCFKRVG